MHDDSRGLPVTTTSVAAITQLDRTMTEYLALGRHTGTYLKATFAEDPDLALAHIIKGYFFQLFYKPTLTQRAASCLALADESIKNRGATDREFLHRDALAAWINGHTEHATRIWEIILDKFPLDVLALRLSHFTHFYDGNAKDMRSSLERVLPAWTPNTPGYGYVLGCHAFGLEETGDYPAAEALGRKAIALNPQDPWAIHAVAHVMEMQGRHREGVAWLDQLEKNWKGANAFAGHIAWHRTLFLLEAGQFSKVLDLYDQEVRSDPTSDDYLDIANAASLLWRLHSDGIDVGTRWKDLAEIAATRMSDQSLVFADLHYLLTFCGAERPDLATKMLATMTEASSNITTTHGQVMQQVGLNLGKALTAIASQDWKRAITLLQSREKSISLIGGSNAQRDLFARLLLYAALAAKDVDLTQTLLRQRLEKNPHSGWAWRRQADLLQSLNDDIGAAVAREKARAQAN